MNSGSARGRGGGWNNPSINLRASNRNNNPPDNHNNNVGFRLATRPACPATCRIVRLARIDEADTPFGVGASADPGRFHPAKDDRAAPGLVVPTCEHQGAAQCGKIEARVNDLPGPDKMAR
jgi:hypothetical protein